MTDPGAPAAEPGSGYAPVNGLQMYYEVHGSGGGRPLVLLHGNLSTIGVDFGRVIPALAKGRQVIAVEQQAHGHTADIDRPLSIRLWADDTAALLGHLGVGHHLYADDVDAKEAEAAWQAWLDRLFQQPEDEERTSP